MSESWGEPVKKKPKKKYCPFIQDNCHDQCGLAVPHANDDGWSCAFYVIAFHLNLMVDEVKEKL